MAQPLSNSERPRAGESSERRVRDLAVLFAGTRSHPDSADQFALDDDRAPLALHLEHLEPWPFAYLHSFSNTIAGGTSEVQHNIIAERVLGLPREPDPWQKSPWRDVPRS